MSAAFDTIHSDKLLEIAEKTLNEDGTKMLRVYYQQFAKSYFRCKTFTFKPNVFLLLFSCIRRRILQYCLTECSIWYAKAAVRKCSPKSVSLKISQDAQESKHLSRSFVLTNLQAWSLDTLLKRDTSTGVFLWVLHKF